jgi:hypothetical protein
MKFVSGKRIEIGRELSDLDIFALDFIRILGRHTEYTVVSGYVSILLGRARTSEDIDIIIPKMDFQIFRALLRDIARGGFYCLNAEEDEDIFDQIKSKTAVRFAKLEKVIPNIELKFAKNKFDEMGLKNKITIKLESGEIAISPLEMQIAFKEEILRSPKDIEDARHIRNVASAHLDKKMIGKYKVMLHGFYGRK